MARRDKFTPAMVAKMQAKVGCKPRLVPCSAATAGRIREHLTAAVHEAGLDLRRTSKSAIEAVILGALECAADGSFRFDVAEVAP